MTGCSCGAQDAYDHSPGCPNRQIGMKYFSATIEPAGRWRWKIKIIETVANRPGTSTVWEGHRHGHNRAKATARRQLTRHRRRVAGPVTVWAPS